MIGWLVEGIILILAIPVGYLIAYLAKDELVQGRKWFRVIMILSLIGALGGYLWGNYAIMLADVFVLIVSWISFVKSSDLKFIKKKIKK